MAITYRTTGVYDSASSASAVVPKPTGTSDGDLMFVVIRRDAIVAPTVVPTGWVLVQSVLSTYGWWLYRKVASGEGASWTWTWAAASKMLGRSHSFYGNINTTTPIQNSTTPYSGTTSGTTITIPTLTTSANNTLSILFTSAYSTSAKTFTVPTSPAYTEHNDTGNTNPDFWQAIASYNYPTSGTATGAIAYPASGNSTYRTGCRVLVNSVVAPTVTTQAVTSVTDTTATGNGNITDNGGATITEKGVCYMTGTSGDPTTANSKFYDNTNSTGAFTESMTGLSSSTNYRVRAYAINSAGTSYGVSVQLTTNTPPTVVLNTPSDTATVADTTPTLAFTGTDIDADTIEYNVEIGPANYSSLTVEQADVMYLASISGGASISQGAIGQSFTADGTPIAKISSFTAKQGSPTGDLVMTIRDSINGNVLASTSVATGSIFNSEWTDFIFNPSLQTVNGQKYYIHFIRSPDTYDGTDFFYIGMAGGNLYPNGGYFVRDPSGTWGVEGSTNYDLSFKIHNFVMPVTIEQTAHVYVVDITGGSGTGTNAQGQVFIADGTPIAQISTFMQIAGSPAGDLVMTIRDSINGNVLATSTTVLASSIVTDWTSFDFYPPFQTVNGQKYYAHLFRSPDTYDTTDTIYAYISSGNLYPNGGYFEKKNGAWDIESTDYDWTFRIQSPPVYLDLFSTSDTGFTAGHPFASGATIDYTVQAGDALTSGTYYWRVAGVDPSGTNTYGAWSSTYSFTVTTGSTGIKVWNGTSWNYKPVKVWDGATWVAKPVKVWNGSSWDIKG